MLSDLISILLTIALLSTCIHGIKTKYRILAVAVLTLSVLPILFSVVINIPIIISPLTPKAHGKVIDVETNKPLADINIKAGWIVGGATVAGASGGYYKLYKTKTDSNGEFVLPRAFKALNERGLVGTREFGGVTVVIYPQTYDYKVVRINYMDNGNIEVRLEKVRSDKEFLENINVYWHTLSLMHKTNKFTVEEPYEIKWLKNAYYEFEKLYPNSSEDEAYLNGISSMLDTLKQPDCVYILQKILAKYPNNRGLVWYANNNINRFKNIYDIK